MCLLWMFINILLGYGIFLCLPVLATSNHYVLHIIGNTRHNVCTGISRFLSLISCLLTLNRYHWSNTVNGFHYTTFEFLAHARVLRRKRGPYPPPSSSSGNFNINNFTKLNYYIRVCLGQLPHPRQIQ